MSILRSSGICLLSILITACLSVSAPESAEAEVSFDVFYSNLSPHGHWLVSGNYGRVWQPSVYAAGWSPYYDGHWIYSDVGWTWVSDYEWGAVPYHYGTWVIDADFGWVWVPGYVWAPAWVVFRTGPDYIGWTPVSVGYSVGMSIGPESYGPDTFVFVASRDFLAPRVRGYAVPTSDTRVIINRTTIENNIRIENNVVVNAGPDVSLVQRSSGQRIVAEPIERVPKIGPGRHLGREGLRVDAAGSRTRLRAAEPISEKESETIINRGPEKVPGPRVNSDANAKAEAQEKAKADDKANADTRGKAHPRKKREGPKPPPPEDKP